MIKKMIDKTIREIEPATVIIYKNQINYEIYFKDVFVFYSLFHFSFFRSGNVFHSYVIKNYLPYVLKGLKENHISYIIVDVRNSYHLIEKKNFDSNRYHSFYQKGRRLYKRRKQIMRLMNELKQVQLIDQKIQEIYYFLEGVCHEIN